MHTHTVRFYKTSQFLCADVADFLCRGLAQGYAAIAVIMKESHEALLIQQLTQRGFAVPLLIAAGQLVLADCADLLPRFMDGDVPNAARFEACIAPLLDGLQAKYGQVFVYGELVNVLTCTNRPDAAIELENIWCSVLSSRPSVLLHCGYALEAFKTAEMAKFFTQVCQTHQTVFPTEDYALLHTEQDQRQLVVDLQQKALMLETEVLVRRRMEEMMKEQNRQLTQAKLAAEAAASTKASFLSMISHELRTPLVAISGYAEMLSRPEVTLQETKEAAQIIASSSKLLCHLLNDILDLSKIEAARLKIDVHAVQLPELLKQLCGLHRASAHTKGLDLFCQLDPDIPCEVYTDEFRLRQILTNLLSNALKFTSQGAITLRASLLSAEQYRDQLSASASPVSTSCAPPPSMCASVTPADTVSLPQQLSSIESHAMYLQCAISDTGVGIDPAFEAQLFTAFAQGNVASKNYGGTGVGLAISRSLARLLGGDLILTRTSSQHGTTFTLTVRVDPVSSERVGQSESPAVTAKRTLSPHHTVDATSSNMSTPDITVNSAHRSTLQVRMFSQ